MAYSDWGALIWKNGKEVTQKYADSNCTPDDNLHWIIENEKETEKSRGGHAVIPFKNILIEFTKGYVTIYILDKDGNILTKEIDREKDVYCLANGFEYYEDDELIFSIDGCELNNSIYRYDILFPKANDRWLVIVGTCLGKGYEKKKVTKLFKKTTYKKAGDEFYYFLPTETSIFKLDYYIRKDERKWSLKMAFRFGIKGRSWETFITYIRDWWYQR